MVRFFQQGIGMIEVLVALLVLAVGVLGFSIVQLRAIEAAEEAVNKLNALNLARDVSERIRANPKFLKRYITKINSNDKPIGATVCIQKELLIPCRTSEQFTDFDVDQILKIAMNQGMTIKIPNCHSTEKSQSRPCIYIAWGETKAIEDTGDSKACTNAGNYLPKAQCVIMEL